MTLSVFAKTPNVFIRIFLAISENCVQSARQILTLFNDLTSILHSLKELSELVECTQTLAGSQVYASARLTYQSVKSVGPKLGLNPVVDSLSRQFQKARQRSVDAGTDESSVTSG